MRSGINIRHDGSAFDGAVNQHLTEILPRRYSFAHRSPCDVFARHRNCTDPE
jgi:hypothetical protein